MYPQLIDTEVGGGGSGILNVGSIPLNIHEVWSRPNRGGNCHQKKTREGHFIGHIPFSSLEGDKRPGNE